MAVCFTKKGWQQINPGTFSFGVLCGLIAIIVTRTVVADPRISNFDTWKDIRPPSKPNSIEVTAKDVIKNTQNVNKVCGLQYWPSGSSLEGGNSTFGKWSWTIAVHVTYFHPSQPLKCAAVLLNENWAITTASCVYGMDLSEIVLRLGEYDSSRDDEPYPHVDRRVQMIVSHPFFNESSKTYENDLALLRFSEPVHFQPNILPICLPDDDDDYVGKMAHVTGWARTTLGGPKVLKVRKEVEVPIMSNSDCEAMFLKSAHNESIPHVFVCAGYAEGRKDSCDGDSGAPLVVQRDSDSRFVLAGIVSWGIGCFQPNQPAVHTRISDFRDWIHNIIN